MNSGNLPGGRIRFSLSKEDRIFLQALLISLSEHYKNPKNNQASQVYWDGKISTTKPTEENGLEEAQEMLKESRGELRDERAELCKTWLNRLSIHQQEPMTFDLKPSEQEEFVAMLNDRRLTLALEAGLSEHEMEIRKTSSLPPAKRLAVTEVNTLAKWISSVIGPQLPHF